MEEEDFHFHFHIHKQDERIDLLVAKIDDVQASFNELNTAVRDFLNTHEGTVDSLQQELDALKADDSVEDAKLGGLQSGIDQLKSEVASLSAPTEPTDGTDETPEEPAP